MQQDEQITNLGYLYGCGYNLIPCNEKKPCVKWKEWQELRIPPDRYRAWVCGQFEKADGSSWQLNDNRRINWAVLSGGADYSDAVPLVCVDCDDAEALDLATSRCPATACTQRTPGGGKHLIYRRPGRLIASRNRTVYKGHRFKLDIKADGGYFMCPGSRKDGRTYEWSEPWTRAMLAALPVYDPAWLPHTRPLEKTYDDFEWMDHEDALELTAIPIELRVEQAEAWLGNCPGSTQGRGADNYCFGLAMTLLWGYLLPPGDAYQLLYDWGQQDTNVDCFGVEYLWSASQIRHKIDNALHTTPNEPLGVRISSAAYIQQIYEDYGYPRKN